MKNKFKRVKTLKIMSVCLLFSFYSNAQTWSSVGNGTVINNTVLSLAFNGSTLIAGGNYYISGGNTENYVDKWNGTSWSALGSSSAPNPVLALATHGSNTAFGGEFDYVYDWNGSGWSSIGYVSATTRAFTVDGSGNLYQGGDNDHVEEYAGGSWYTLGGSFNGSIYALAVYNGSIYAGGNFTTVNSGGTTADYIAKWNGTAWVAVGSGMNNTVRSLLVFNTDGDLYAGGGFTTAGGNTADYIAKWNGTTWSAVGGGMNSIVYCLAQDSYGYLEAGGGFTKAGGNTANYIARFGGTWASLGTGTSNGTNNDVFALAVDANSGYLYVGGSFTAAGGSSSNSRIAKWSIPPTRVEDVNEISENNAVVISPNPSNGIFSVTLYNNSNRGQIELYNMIGEKVYSSNLNYKQSYINCAHQPIGVYLYRILSENGSLISSGKLVIQ